MFILMMTVLWIFFSAASVIILIHEHTGHSDLRRGDLVLIFMLSVFGPASFVAALIIVAIAWTGSRGNRGKVLIPQRK